MKVSVLFVLFATALIIKENFCEKSVEKNLKSDEKSSVAAAIVEILEKFYSKKDHRVDILCYPCKTTKSAALFNEIPKYVKIDAAFRVFKPSEKIQINASTIMIFDTKADHDKLMDKMKFDKFATNEPYHLIYYSDMKQKGLKITTESKYENINYIQDLNKTHLNLITLEHFVGKKCDKTQPKAINYFTKSIRKWKKNDEYFPDKFKDFHGCEFSFGKEFNDINNFAPSKHKKFGEKNYEINEAITKKLNIKSKYLTCPRNKNTREKVCPNARVPEMFLETAFLFQYNYKNDTQLESFNFDNYAGFLIPPGKLIDCVFEFFN
jgi:hypothetical protein